MRKVIKATALMMVLAFTVWAGNIGCPADEGDIGMPVVQQSSSEPTRDGNMGAPRAATDAVVRVLSSLLALL